MLINDVEFNGTDEQFYEMLCVKGALELALIEKNINGIGAPDIGKSIRVIAAWESNNHEYPVTLFNPKIIKSDVSELGDCLASVSYRIANGKERANIFIGELAETIVNEIKRLDS